MSVTPDVLDIPALDSYRLTPQDSRVGLEVESIDDASRFALLQREWTELLQASDADCLFLSWEWLYTWWQHLAAGRELQLLTVRHQGRLLAIAPLAVRPRQPERLLPFRALDFLGTGVAGSDYLDIIVRRGSETAALHALAEYLDARGYALELRQIKAGSINVGHLAQQLQSRGWHAQQVITDICPYLELAGKSWESYLAGVGPAHRQNVRRRLRRIAGSFRVEFTQVRTEAQRRECLPLFFELHRLRWERRRGSQALDAEGVLGFHDEFSRLALQRGWLRLFTLSLDGQAAASIYAFRYGKVFYFYQSGFDPGYEQHSVGLVTMALTIQRALEEGASEYDMLHGDEAYKFLWARGGRDLMKLECSPPGVDGVIYRQAAGLREGIKRVVAWPHRMKGNGA